MTALLVLAGLILLVSSMIPSNTQRIVVHPQLIGVALWAVGHLLVNGDLASVILFGGFLLFALVNLVLAICLGKGNALERQPIVSDAKV